MAPTTIRRGLAALLLLTNMLWLFGCDPKRISELEEGVSTEADVRARFGESPSMTLRRNHTRAA